MYVCMNSLAPAQCKNACFTYLVVVLAHVCCGCFLLPLDLTHSDLCYFVLFSQPGFHKQADDFNRIQRGHQNFFETLTSYTALALIGGLKHPLICAVGGPLFCIGSVLYQTGYSDTSLKVETARYQKGGIVKWFGLLGALGSTISLAGSIQGWW